MDPDIVQDHPGACPKCGMALQARQLDFAAGDDQPNPELIMMTQRFWISTALALPVLMLSMSEMIPGAPLTHALGAQVIVWIRLALTTPIVLWGAKPFLRACGYLGGESQPQHVHPGRTRDRNRLWL